MFIKIKISKWLDASGLASVSVTLFLAFVHYLCNGRCTSLIRHTYYYGIREKENNRIKSSLMFSTFVRNVGCHSHMQSI